MILAITAASFIFKSRCYLVVYVSDKEDIFVEEIERDRVFWTNTILPKLNRFYNDCILEEIATKRCLRGERCFDPVWIEDAVKLKQEKQTAKKKLQDSSKNELSL
ncbi:hypothetical protein ILUMI_20704 [Ignelater luminosus]|uniref:Uncharacterized protein n=1 Tax=Ignelater luminosus TaxID=2038154 RepID=A0A8K0CHY8_IGNLU|nr:hypothetical protein ILUMI_20704 [Ignelater luminosus]